MSVKDLRAKTGAGFLECKKALDEAAGDLDKAALILKEKGALKAAKRSDYSAEEGVVAVSNDNSAIIFLASETDFVSKGDHFCEFATEIANSFASSSSNDVMEIKSDKISDLKESIINIAAKVGENVSVKQSAKLEAKAGFKNFSFVHRCINDNFSNAGMIGVILQVSENCSDEDAKNLCMHIASSNPTFISTEELTCEWKEEAEKTANLRDLKISVLEKEAVLEKQTYLLDSSLDVAGFLKKNSIVISKFYRLSVK